MGRDPVVPEGDPVPLSLRKTLLAIIAMLTLAVTTYAATTAEPGTGDGQPVPPIPTASSTPIPPPVTSPPPVASGCVAPAGMTGLRDQDPEDSQNPWKRTAGQKAVINVDSSKVANSPEWMGYLRHAAEFWNISPCVDVRIVNGCPAGQGCGKFAVVAKGDDGNFDEITKGGFNVGGNITVLSSLKGKPLNVRPDGTLTDPLAVRAQSCSQRLNVAVHELGHLIGLRHVKTLKVIMDPETYPDVCGATKIGTKGKDGPVLGGPDQGALDNLAYSYTKMQKPQL